MNDGRFLTVAEVAKKLRLTPATVRDYIRQGKLNARKVGKQFLLTESDLTTFLERTER